MLSNRRVGTLTLGVVLIVVGLLSLANVLLPLSIPPWLYLRLWPVVLILIGVEVLAGWVKNKEAGLRYDGWAIFIIGCLLLFTACIMALQTALEYGPWYL